MHFFLSSGVLFYVGVQRSSSVVLLPDPVVGEYAHLWVSGKAAVNGTSAGSKMHVCVCVCVCETSCMSVQICSRTFKIVRDRDFC